MSERSQRAAVPRLSGVVVHWGDPGELGELAEAWPEDLRFELVVVDNGGTSGQDRERQEATWQRVAGRARVIRPGGNLGFAGGANAGAEAARGDLLLILNSDVVVGSDALEALLEGFDRQPEAAGLAPRMIGKEGADQSDWQLRRLPTVRHLLLQAVGFEAAPKPSRPPATGEPVEQPAAAALALRREALVRIGGFDPGFHPAWFEDVDLAKRLRNAGLELLYWPRASVRHRQGATVSELGYGRFLWAYERNLLRYVGKHHGRWATAAAWLLIVFGLGLRFLQLPVRRPQRARSRWEAVRGLPGALVGALSGWKRPRRWGQFPRSGSAGAGAAEPAPADPGPEAAGRGDREGMR